EQEGTGGGGMFLPGALDLGTIALRAVAVEEFPVRPDAPGNEILRRLEEDRAPFLGVGAQQVVASPAREPGGELPAEIGDIIEAAVEPVRSVRRMAVGGVAGDEDAAHLVAVGGGDAQIPEAHIVELAGETESGGLLQQALKVVVVPRGVGRDRSVKKELLADVDAAEELPIALQIRMHDAVGGARRKALEPLVEL